MNDIINVGIVGLGGGGRAQIDYFYSIEGVEVKALCDIHSNVLKSVVREKQLKDVFTTTNYNELVSRKDIDVISICSPDQFHAEYSIKALYTGKHVLCEKPMATSLEECGQLINAVEKTGLIFATQHQMRFVPLFSKIKSIIDSGELGDIFVLEGDYLHDLTERAREFDSWRLDPANYHPPLLGAGCHFVDLFRWYSSSKVNQIFCYANHIAFRDYPEADCVVTIFKFDNGCIGKITTAFGCKRPLSHPVHVYGTKGTISNNLLYKGHQLDRIIYEPPLGKRKKLACWILRRLDVTYEEYPFPLYEHKIACINSLTDFINAIRKGSKPLVDVYEGAKTVAVCIAGTQSYRQNRPVEVT
ncbi:Myo-inositol 2-dehydrogenase [subsurface metagenome]